MRFAHTNIIAEDWRRLAGFYIEVFGCRMKPPERRQSGEWLAKGTGVAGATLQGVHLLLPGHGENGPTLEIYTYSKSIEAERGPANLCGFRHIAFQVDDVEITVRSILDHGGSLAGEITNTEVSGVGALTFVYARDPEGNLLEIQSWSIGDLQ